MNINKKDSFGHVFSYSKADDANNNFVEWLINERGQALRPA